MGVCGVGLEVNLLGGLMVEAGEFLFYILGVVILSGWMSWRLG